MPKKLLLFTKKCLHALKACLVLVGLAGMPLRASAQDALSSDSTLWPLVAQRLDQRLPADTSFQFILDLVRAHCGQEADCLLRNYKKIMVKLERERFHLPAAMAVAEERRKIAHQHHRTTEEAHAYKSIGAYYDSQGQSFKAIVAFDRALELYQKAGEKYQVTVLNVYRITLKKRPLQAFLPDVRAILAKTVAENDTQSIRYLHSILLDATIEAKAYAEAAQHIAYLEKVPVSVPILPKEYGMLIKLNMSRGMLAEAERNPVEAERFYQQALRLCEAEPSRWLEIKMLYLLANMEWQRGEAVLAKSYLNRAQEKAENLQLDDLLQFIFQLKAEIAEAEGDFEKALHCLKKAYLAETRFKDKDAEFDLKSYTLQLEKDQLSAENRTRDLQLQLRNTQLRSMVIGTLLMLLLAVFLFVGLRRQQKQKQHLAKQNRLIQQQAEQLRSLDDAKSRFFANVSHELRTPLTLMLGPVHTLLKEKNWPEKQRRLLHMASQSGKQLEQLIAEILDLRKLESGKMGLDEKPTPLHSFFHTYLSQFESLAAFQQIDFTSNIDAAQGLVVQIDQAKCRQILYNLLSNAFKFTPAKGRISTDISVKNGWLGLTVTDSGAGIHPDDLPQVFDRFFQTSRPDKPVEGGTGIGLNLCQEYARLFGGTIEVSSAEGEGSAFRVRFPVTIVEASTGQHALQPLETEAVEGIPKPLADSSLPATPDHEPAAAPGTGAKPTLLVVEDNIELQAYIRLVLQDKYQVLTVENGQEALNTLRRAGSSPPDLIISDLMMPVMDGYQLLETLKSDDATRHLPVIMLTARAEAQDRLKALRIGVDDYLLKPFDEEELLARIENLLTNFRNRRWMPENALAAANETPFDNPTIAQTDRTWLENFEAYVRKNLSSDLLSIPMLAHEFAMSESTLLRQLKRLTGLSPLQYLQEMRLDRARQLLENRVHDSIARVASEVGYGDARSFSRSFKQRFGKLPSDAITH